MNENTIDKSFDLHKSLTNIVKLSQFRIVNSIFAIINNDIYLLNISNFSNQIYFVIMLNCNAIKFKQFNFEQLSKSLQTPLILNHSESQERHVIMHLTIGAGAHAVCFGGFLL